MWCGGDSGSRWCCTLMCLVSCVGKRSSSTSFTAALPLNKSMVIPGGRRPWCCCHFRDFREKQTITAKPSDKPNYRSTQGYLAHLSEQSHQTWGWYHTDFTGQSLSNGCSTLLFTAAVRISLLFKKTYKIHKLCMTFILHYGDTLFQTLSFNQPSPLWGQSTSEPEDSPGGCIAPAGFVSTWSWGLSVSIKTWQLPTLWVQSAQERPAMTPHHLSCVQPFSHESKWTESLLIHMRQAWEASYLFIKVDQGLIWEFERLYSLKDSIPMTAIDISHKTLNTVHGVQGHCCLLLQCRQSLMQTIFLQILHDQTDHARETD